MSYYKFEFTEQLLSTLQRNSPWILIQYTRLTDQVVVFENKEKYIKKYVFIDELLMKLMYTITKRQK